MLGAKPTVREMEVSDPWASFIFDGKKKVEVRKNDPSNWGALRAGDFLNIKNKQTGEVRPFKIVEIRSYTSLDRCIVAEGVRHLLPGNHLLEVARQVYLGFDGNDQETMLKREAEYNKFGCIAIELEPRKPGLELVKQADGLSIYEEKSNAWYTKIDTKKLLQLHVQGSSKPEGDPNCPHTWEDGKKATEYNDDTMGGCGSGWDQRCNRCGKVWN